MSKIYFIKGDTKYVPYEKTVNIHNAPTDESIRLYDEMREKAEKSIIDSFSINTTLFSCHVVVAENPEFYDAFTIWFKLKLNDETITDSFKIERYRYEEDTVKEVVSKISNIITSKLLGSISSESLNIIFRSSGILK